MTCSRNSLQASPAPGWRRQVEHWMCLVLSAGPLSDPHLSEQLALPSSPATRGCTGIWDRWGRWGRRGHGPQGSSRPGAPVQITKSSWSAGLKAAARRMSRVFTRMRVPVRCFQRLVMGFFILSRPVCSSWMTSR